ncbi:hypothetical protein F5141DRAFT_107628 [Pisolithus sp. B1]|nr:hypothetical protein F5141DRAFT_107628 [Pisolithus sp. B1]
MERWYHRLLPEPPACRLTPLPCFMLSLTGQPSYLASPASQPDIPLPSVSSVRLASIVCLSLVIGTGADCQAIQPSACCTDDNFDGLVTVGCSPMNINA